MNKFLLIILLLVGSAGVMAQNKTLGVGTPSPNPNAVLHLVAPTNNQGFLMPRMTTAQRTAPGFTSALSTTDIGLMVYDTDLLGVFVWEGAQWSDQTVSATTTATTGNAGYFSINNPANSGAALYATTNGSGVTSAAIVAETATAFSAITARGTGAAANALSGIISDPGPGGYGVLGTVSATGGGQAGVFNIFNPANANNTLEVTTIGTGGAGYFKVTNAAATKTALWSETNSNQPLTAAVYGLNTGTGDAAGVFRINNAGSNKQAVFAETNGTGSSVQGLNLGTGNGAYFRKNGSNAGSAAVWADNFGNDGYGAIIQNISATNPKAALFAESVGPGPSIWAFKDTGEQGNAIEATQDGTTGNAGNFTITNATSNMASLFATTNGTGAGINAQNTGAGNGFAGQFEITNGNNTFPAIQAHSKGTGSAMRVFQGATDGPGTGLDVFMYNTSSTAPGVMVDQTGLGEGASFNINRAASTNAAIRATTNGTGDAFFANHTGASGNIAIFQSGSTNVARIDKTGKGFFNGGTQASGADVAEMFDVEGTRNEYEPGDVLIISETTDRTVEKSNTPNSTKVAGVYATKPGVVLTEKSIEENLEALVPMGVVGVIPTKVCFENGPIKRGDLLVTSSIKGHAMKAVPVIINGVEIYPTGAILGKALENFESGEKGLIKVLVNVK